MGELSANTPHYKDWDYCARAGGCRFELDMRRDFGFGTPILCHVIAKDEGKLKPLPENNG